MIRSSKSLYSNDSLLCVCILRFHQEMDNQRSTCEDKETVKKKISVGNSRKFQINRKKNYQPDPTSFRSIRAQLVKNKYFFRDSIFKILIRDWHFYEVFRLSRGLKFVLGSQLIQH